MYIIPPRAIFVILQSCQPLLISRTIQFVTKDLTPFETRNEAFRLLLFTFIIYTGMAVRRHEEMAAVTIEVLTANIDFRWDISTPTRTHRTHFAVRSRRHYLQ